MLAEIVRAEIVPFCVLTGPIAASFGCVVAERLPARQPLGGRSHCVCGARLRAHQLIPVLSWLATLGRARCCGARIPARYVLAELLMAAAGLVIGLLARAEIHDQAVAWPLVHALLGLTAAFAVQVLACWRRPAADPD